MPVVNQAVALMRKRVEEIDNEIQDCHMILLDLSDVDDRLNKDTDRLLGRCQTAVLTWKSLLIERSEIIGALEIIKEHGTIEGE